MLALRYNFFDRKYVMSSDYTSGPILCSKDSVKKEDRSSYCPMLYILKGKWIWNRQISKTYTMWERAKCYEERWEEMSEIEIWGLTGKITLDERGRRWEGKPHGKHFRENISERENQTKVCLARPRGSTEASVNETKCTRNRVSRGDVYPFRSWKSQVWLEKIR